MGLFREKCRLGNKIRWILACILFCAISMMGSGCATQPYRYHLQAETDQAMIFEPGEPQIERGRPNRFLDGLGHYVVSVPSKLLLWSTRVENHNISERTENLLRDYLEKNSLKSVKVRLNQYSPGAEWRRLHRNRSVSLGWRATLGVLSVINYTIFPGRVFGGDSYNPYTNTINLYSDHEAIALHEGGHAKDLARRTHKGPYAAFYNVPGIPLYMEGVATGDVIGYLRAENLVDEEKDAYKILYPAYSTYITGEGLRWVDLPDWAEYLVAFGVAIPAHIFGRIKAATVDDTRVVENPEDENAVLRTSEIRNEVLP